MKKLILLVDDDRESAEIVGDKLRRNDYRVDLVFDSREAVELARKNRPDLIILDILMPELGGSEVGMLLRADPELNRIPLIYLTNLIARNEVVGGPIPVVSKMDLNDLVLRIARILGPAPA